MKNGTFVRTGATQLAAAVALALLASGCSLAPTYQRPVAAVAPAYPAGPAYNHSGRHGATPAALTGWREFLLDSRLQQLVELALQNNQDLRTAALNGEKVRAQYDLAHSALLPTVGLEAGYNKANQNTLAGGHTNPTRDADVGLQVAWAPDFFGRLRSLSEVAAQQYLASAHARQAAQLLLVSQVADQYLAMLADDEQLIVTRQTLATAQTSFKLIKLQFDTGTASELDMRLSETTLELAKANEAAQVRSRAQAENGLVLLLGQPMPFKLPPAVRLGDQPILTDIPAGLPSDLLVRRPDILEAEDVLRGENANIGAARAAFFPNITLTGLFGAGAPALGDLFGAGTKVWSLGPQLVAPLFDGGANRANLDVAKIQKDIGVAAYQKTVQTAFREVADGLAARGTYDTQLAALQKYTDAEQRRLDLATLRYNNGIDDYLQVLTAQTDLYNAQLQLIAARQNRLSNLVDLYRALGGGWLEHTGTAPRPADSVASSATQTAS